MTPNVNAGSTAERLTGESSINAQDILQLGEDASRLLGSDVCQVMYQRQMWALFLQWLETVAKEREKREGLYNQAKGLQQMMHNLGAAVQDAQRILTEQQEQQSPDAQHQQYLDTQGFFDAQQ